MLGAHLADVHHELEALRAASSAATAAAERQRVLHAERTAQQRQAAQREATATAEAARVEEARVQQQLTVLSRKHVHELNEAQREYKVKLALADAQAARQGGVIKDAFAVAGHISDDVTVVDAHLCQVQCFLQLSSMHRSCCLRTHLCVGCCCVTHRLVSSSCTPTPALRCR